MDNLLDDVHRRSFNVGLCLDIYRPVSLKFHMVIDTTQLYTVIPL